jgi:hypothetical protein
VAVDEREPVEGHAEILAGRDELEAVPGLMGLQMWRDVLPAAGKFAGVAFAVLEVFRGRGEQLELGLSGLRRASSSSARAPATCSSSSCRSWPCPGDSRR